ncbi:hypothetical protein KGQ71_01725 [Patescibacteria group bacterium]|nr:hypothetical protein [Patescibacteria group bacterium]
MKKRGSVAGIVLLLLGILVAAGVAYFYRGAIVSRYNALTGRSGSPAAVASPTPKPSAGFTSIASLPAGPTSVPSPTPTPVLASNLPRSGPDINLADLGVVALFIAGIGYYWSLRRCLMKSWREINIAD